MRFSIRVDLFHQFFCIVPGSCWDLFLHLLLRVGVGLDVSTVNEDGLGRQIACLGYLIQNPRKYPIHGLFGEAMPEVIAHRGKMRRFLLQGITEKPAIAIVCADFVRCPPQRGKAVQMLDSASWMFSVMTLRLFWVYSRRFWMAPRSPRVEDITEALWGSKVSPATISELNKKAYVHIEDWRNRPLQGGRYPYVYVDGIYLRRNWGGEYENVAILVAIAVNEDGFREVLGAAEGMKEDKASWVSFFQWLRGRGLDGVKLIVGDKCMGMLEAVGEVFPDAKYQRCTVHFYRNVFSVVPKSKAKIVAKMLKAIHAQESKKASREKAKAVVAELRAMKLKEAAKKVEEIGRAHV